MAATRIHVVLDESLVRAIDERVGKRGRSRFIEEAILLRTAQIRQLDALDRVGGVWDVAAHPELSVGAAAWIDRSRKADQKARSRRRP